ncbi:hypothetical protein Rhe02_56560 [Rhizocola hellebori]|uniref:AAA+ ATPase domain-containing protein n=1 Tax=Rhizocola hellebori TaxID=1392758 RepID=A0A8J3QB82_9ACTN|nr:ATP-binding protein [Rhizocola hellebori]GIH07589.1 hypothetical protein Rhe02_56560 [Rhizocola hellebori]
MVKDGWVGSKISFAEIKDLAAKDRWDQELITGLDRFLGVSLLLTPAVMGPTGLFALELLQPKDELIKLARAASKRLLSGKPGDFLARHQRLNAAHLLLHYSAFFEAIELEAPQLARAMALTDEERQRLVERALSNPDEAMGVPEFMPPAQGSVGEHGWRHERYRLLALRYLKFVSELAAWEAIDATTQRSLELMLWDKVVARAMELFDAQYLELLIEVPAFAKWAEIYEFTRLRKLTADLSEATLARVAEVAESAKTIDVGLANLQSLIEANALAVADRPEQAQKVARALAKAYAARIEEPVIVDKFHDSGVRLTYPKRREAYVPQAFQALRHLDPASKLELEPAWLDTPVHDDLGHYLVTCLESVLSTQTPLLVLGHPGSGKSLLTEMLAATLGEQYHPIRIELRDADADADLQDQIELRIRHLTGYDVNWASYAEALAVTPPVIILDGYDELLQASGRVFSNYLNKVQSFQRREALHGRPVRVIVTSRITLIDKAAVPIGSTVVRLLDFDQSRRDLWTRVWNEVNRGFFAHQGIEPFLVDAGSRVIQLAAQPLLLLMLAVYDSAGNGLRDAQLDRTSLYHSLLTRFIERERTKGDGAEAFAALSADQQRQQIELDLERLGVAAIGMFNRRALHIQGNELNRDIAHFKLSQPVEVAHGQPLTQAELLLGSFFFIHESKSHVVSAEPVAFEFLHNTFGEFLTADFLLRRVLSETSMLRKLSGDRQFEALRLQRLAEPESDWYSRTMFTSVHTRPVVLTMMHEWLPHRLAEEGRSPEHFEADLAALALRQTDLVLNGVVPGPIARPADNGFGSLPLLGHLAVYSLNMILLWAHLTRTEVEFDERMMTVDTADCRPWDRLTHLWRSWFALDTLASLPHSLRSTRNGGRVWVSRPVVARDTSNRLDAAWAVAGALADGIAYGTAVVCAYEAGNVSHEMLPTAARTLAQEGISIDAVVEAKLAQRGVVSVAKDAFALPEVVAPGPHLRPTLVTLLEVVDRACSVDEQASLGSMPGPSFSDCMAHSRYESALMVRHFTQFLGPGWAHRFLSAIIESDPGNVSTLLRSPFAAPLLLQAAHNCDPFRDGLDSLGDAADVAGAAQDLATAVALCLYAQAAGFPELEAAAWQRTEGLLSAGARLHNLQAEPLTEIIEAALDGRELADLSRQAQIETLAAAMLAEADTRARSRRLQVLELRLAARTSSGLAKLDADHRYLSASNLVDRGDLAAILRLCCEIDDAHPIRALFGTHATMAQTAIVKYYERVRPEALTVQEAADLERLSLTPRSGGRGPGLRSVRPQRVPAPRDDPDRTAAR